MSLESLAPDQRAVVQLVLQQGRSYADLAGLLGISEDAVRQRARAGLSLLGADASLSEDDQGRISDYLLGQQEGDERAATHALLESSPAALDWAEFVSEDLRPVARHGLPELPASAAPEPEPEPVQEPEAEEVVESDPEPEGDEPEPVEPDRTTPRSSRRERPARRAAEPESAPRARRGRPTRRERQKAGEPVSASRRRERQRPRRDRDADAPAATAAEPAARESSRLGGALLLAVIAALVAAGVVYLFNRNEDEPAATNTTSTEASASPSATPQAVAQLPLKGAGGSKAEGLVQINAPQEGQQLTFTLVARNMATTKRGESAYAIWLIGKDKPALRLGFGEVLANQGGTLAVQGPEEQVDPQAFIQGLQTYSELIVSRETSSDAKEPSGALLRGALKDLAGGAGETGGAAGSGSGN